LAVAYALAVAGPVELYAGSHDYMDVTAAFAGRIYALNKAVNMENEHVMAVFDAIFTVMAHNRGNDHGASFT
jgi:hypothetical protein